MQLKYTTVIMPPNKHRNQFLMAIEAIEAAGNYSKKDVKITFRPGKKNYSKPRWHVNFLSYNNVQPDFISAIRAALQPVYKMIS